MFIIEGISVINIFFWFILKVDGIGDDRNLEFINTQQSYLAVKKYPNLKVGLFTKLLST